MVHGVLLDREAKQRGYLQPKAIAQLLKEHDQGQRDNSHILFMLLMFELWFRNFLSALPQRSVPPVTTFAR
jgi:hypothetical protein